MTIDKDTRERWDLEDVLKRTVGGDIISDVADAMRDEMLRCEPYPATGITVAQVAHDPSWPELPKTLWGLPVRFDPSLKPGEWYLTNARAEPPARSILQEAEEIVSSASRDYGSPAVNAARVARLWNGYLLGKYAGRRDFELSPEDVCMLMVLLKVARFEETPKRDTLVDIAGWAAVADDVQRVREESHESD